MRPQLFQCDFPPFSATTEKSITSYRAFYICGFSHSLRKASIFPFLRGKKRRLQYAFQCHRHFPHFMEQSSQLIFHGAWRVRNNEQFSSYTKSLSHSRRIRNWGTIAATHWLILPIWETNIPGIEGKCLKLTILVSYGNGKSFSANLGIFHRASLPLKGKKTKNWDMSEIFRGQKPKITLGVQMNTHTSRRIWKAHSRDSTKFSCTLHKTHNRSLLVGVLYVSRPLVIQLRRRSGRDIE